MFEKEAKERAIKLEESQIVGVYDDDEDCKNWEEMRADLRGADLRGADLRDTKNVLYIPMVCPEERSN